MWVEVLVNALADLRRKKSRRLPALAWIKSNEQHIGSFCCHPRRRENAAEITYFYPKLLSGLIVNKIEPREEIRIRRRPRKVGKQNHLVYLMSSAFGSASKLKPRFLVPPTTTTFIVPSSLRSPTSLRRTGFVPARNSRIISPRCCDTGIVRGRLTFPSLGLTFPSLGLKLPVATHPPSCGVADSMISVNSLARGAPAILPRAHEYLRWVQLGPGR